MPAPSPITAAPAYHLHRPEETALYAIVAEHYPRFVEEIVQSGGNLPKFVHQEFEDYLKRGLLKHGFLRVKCNGCRHEHLVAFSYERRGFCPSGGARRMVESAAHPVDHVFPGAYSFYAHRPTFHRARRPAGKELNDLLDTLSRRIALAVSWSATNRLPP